VKLPEDELVLWQADGYSNRLFRLSPLSVAVHAIQADEWRDCTEYLIPHPVEAKLACVLKRRTSPIDRLIWVDENDPHYLEKVRTRWWDMV
jgi:hypothetical protein